MVTVPLNPQHHVSVSPKAGRGSAIGFAPGGAQYYADLTRSGAETAAHVQENGRMTLNLEKGAPKILRLHGLAQVILAEDASSMLLQKFPVQIVL
jgi:hypothetical protein